MNENHGRSFAKALSWRATATLTTIAIVLALTGELALAAEVGIVDVVAKMILYYGHERIWARIVWGRQAHPLADLALSRELSREDLDVIKLKLGDLGYL